MNEENKGRRRNFFSQRRLRVGPHFAPSFSAAEFETNREDRGLPEVWH